MLAHAFSPILSLSVCVCVCSTGVGVFLCVCVRCILAGSCVLSEFLFLSHSLSFCVCVCVLRSWVCFYVCVCGSFLLALRSLGISLSTEKEILSESLFLRL